MSASQYVIDLDADPFIPYAGWTVLSHRRGGKLDWNPYRVGFYRSKKQVPGIGIVGGELLLELKRQPVLNCNVLDFVLAQPELIPDSWRSEPGCRQVFFWGTIYADPSGTPRVRWLGCHEGRWYSQHLAIGRELDHDDPAVIMLPIQPLPRARVLRR